jgi:hypothetical protein
MLNLVTTVELLVLNLPVENIYLIYTYAEYIYIFSQQTEAVARKNEYAHAPLSRLSPPSPALGVLTPPSSTKKGVASR